MRWRGPALAALLLLWACTGGEQGSPSAPSHPELAAGPPGREGISSARLVRFFDELAFGSPAAPERTSPTLVRWASLSLTYAIEGPAPPDAERRIAERLARFQALTGVTSAPSRGADATMVFEFVPGMWVAVQDEFAACSTRTTYDEAGIRRARISIATEPARAFAACVDHELMHAFGFPHHSSVLPSVMGPLRASDTLSEADEAVLRALYDRRLGVGLARSVAEPLIAQILGETGPVSSRQLGADLEWHAIRPEEAALVFDPSGLERSIRRSFWAVPADGTYLVEISFLSAAEQEWPRASVRYIRLVRGRNFSRVVSPEEIARNWTTVAEASPRFRAAAERPTTLGVLRYAIADTAAAPCVVFVGEIGGISPARLDGFYCAPSGARLDAGAILDRLRLRPPGYHPPAIADAR